MDKNTFPDGKLSNEVANVATLNLDDAEIVQDETLQNARNVIDLSSEKNSQNKVKKSNTSSTFNTGKAFRGGESALNQHSQHLASIEPTIARNSLIVEIDSGNGNVKKTLLIESKACVLLTKALRGFLAYDMTSQTWHWFTGTHWESLETPQQADAVLVSLIYQGAGDIGFRPSYKNGIKSLLTDGDMLELPKADHTKLPFQNGLLELTTKRLTVITPDNAQTWCLPYEYTAGADCSNVKAWLAQAVDNDQETVEFLRAWMAAVLHGRNDLQKFLHLKGSGGTGKGTFMRLLTAVIGKSNAAITSLDQLEQNRFEAAMLYNKRLAIISDSDKYGGSINVLKAITGQDHIRLERKHQQQAGSFVFQGLVVMASNESLQVTDHTSGLDRRRITVIFDRRATNEEKQKWQALGGEEAVLHNELPGLVNWLLELSQEEISQAIRNPPQRIKTADLEAMTASNPIADWLLECCESSSDAWTQIGDKQEIREPGYETVFKNADSWLYANYLQWSQRNGKTPLQTRRFREILTQTCETLEMSVYEVRRSAGMGIAGLRLKHQI